VKGEGWYSVKQKRFAVKPNQYFILPRGVAHEYGSDVKNPWSIYWVSYTGENAEHFTNYLLPGQNNSPVLVAPSALRRMIFEDILDHLGFLNNTGNLIYASSSLYAFLASFQKLHVRFENKRENPIEEVIALMKSNLDKNFSLEQLAHHVHISASRLSALFREKNKYSPIHLYTSFKVQRACQLLLDSSKSVKDIANQLGYEDQYHFSRVFKNSMGISPKFFRESPQSFIAGK
jgi:AraC-like DNA-binding protein